jgi:hypothetical protein
MNTAATHMITNVAAWVEHEEIIAVTLLKKALRIIECEIEAIFVLGLFGICIVNIIVRLSQLSQYAQLISCCD